MNVIIGQLNMYPLKTHRNDIDEYLEKFVRIVHIKVVKLFVLFYDDFPQFGCRLVPGFAFGCCDQIVNGGEERIIVRLQVQLLQPHQEVFERGDKNWKTEKTL